MRSSEWLTIGTTAEATWAPTPEQVPSAWYEFERAAVATRGDLEALMGVLWAYDHALAGHALRVGEGVLDLAAELGLPAGQARRIRDLAWVHDLGALALPPALLRKPERLSADEREIVREQPALTAALLSQIPATRDLSPGVLAIRECWDGSGYPRGIRGPAIPIEARMLAVVEAYDALTSERPYRTALAGSAAVTELVRCAGQQFDPDIVRCWIRTLDHAQARIH